ncbi:MAG: peptidoglycan-binding domain-containing protein, partial [Myxococcota bacterium]
MIRIRPTPAVLPTSLAQGSATQTGTGGGEPALASRPAPLPSANPRSLELSPASGATVHLAGGQGTPLPLDGPVGVPINTEADVEWVQQRLVAMGRLEESAITGQMNEATAAAVRALQVDEGLRPDGVISPEMTTNEALNADAETPRTLTGRVQERDVDEHNLPGNVAAVERALRTREELAGDEPWLEALLNFQSRFMSRPDGVISPGGTTARLLNTPRSQWDSILVRRDTLL